MTLRGPTGADRNVECVILAEFDITTGNSIKYQYPEPLGIDEQVLAEFMLPDGSHKREDDWSIFFLFRPSGTLRDSTPRPTSPAPSSSLVPKRPQPPTAPPQPSSSSVKTSQCTMEPSGVYRFDQGDVSAGWTTVAVGPRGWRLVLGTSPVVSVSVRDAASDRELFRVEEHETLEVLRMDDTFVGVQDSERTAVGFRFATAAQADQFSRHVFVMMEAVDEAARLQQAQPRPQPQPQPQPQQGSQAARPRQFLNCLNLIHNKLDSTAARGSVLKALAICTPHPFVDAFKPLVLLHLERYFKKSSLSVLSELYDILNSVDLTPACAIPEYRKIILRNTNKIQDRVFAAPVTMPTVSAESKAPPPQLKLRIPLTRFPDEVADCKVLPLVTKFGRQVMTIYNALLTEKRVIFLGFGCRTNEVCSAVLGAVSLLCPPLRGLVHRAFPYANLCFLDMLEVKGFVAGVMNPMFEEKAEWWDVLCNLETGRVTVNPKIAQSFPDPSHAESDSELFEEAEFYRLQFAEEHVRQLFHRYTRKLTDMSFGEAVFPDEETQQRELSRNLGRISQWKGTESYSLYKRDRDLRLKYSPMGASGLMLCTSNLAVLTSRKNVPDEEVVRIFECFLNYVKTPSQAEEFLSYLPDSEGGLFPVAVGLFHANRAVRQLVLELFKRLQQTEAGRHHLQGLNLYVAMAYRRLVEGPSRLTKEKERQRPRHTRTASSNN